MSIVHRGTCGRKQCARRSQPTMRSRRKCGGGGWIRGAPTSLPLPPAPPPPPCQEVQGFDDGEEPRNANLKLLRSPAHVQMFVRFEPNMRIGFGFCPHGQPPPPPAPCCGGGSQWSSGRCVCHVSPPSASHGGGGTGHATTNLCQIPRSPSSMPARGGGGQVTCCCGWPTPCLWI